MNNILVTGANGQLGSELRFLSKNNKEYSFFFTDVEDLNINNYKGVKKYISKNSIKIIINCAAYTNVDKAEDEFEEANSINHLAVRNLANITKELEIKLVHISTDYVFDGKNHKPYLEIDLPNPQSIYGKTKLAGEQAIKNINPSNSIIIRTSWLYSSFGNNFVNTMLNLSQQNNEIKVVSDQIGTPTYARDLAKTILNIIPKVKNENVKVYHYSNEGVCSWYDFTKAIFKIKSIKTNVIPVASKEFPTKATRPYYSVLSKEKIKKEFGIEIPYWRESLED